MRQASWTKPRKFLGVAFPEIGFSKQNRVPIVLRTRASSHLVESDLGFVIQAGHWRGSQHAWRSLILKT
jgi:hypothetical protein